MGYIDHMNTTLSQFQAKWNQVDLTDALAGTKTMPTSVAGFEKQNKHNFKDTLML